MQYSGEFKDGVVFSKGILTWTSPDNRQLKWNGTFDGTQFGVGKLEVRLNDQLVHTIEGTFNLSFNDESEQNDVEETKENEPKAQSARVSESPKKPISKMSAELETQIAEMQKSKEESENKVKELQ